MRHDLIGGSKESDEMLGGTGRKRNHGSPYRRLNGRAMPPLSRKRPRGKRAMKAWRSISTCAAVAACASLSGCGSSATTVTYEVRREIFFMVMAPYMVLPDAWRQ